MYRIAVTGASGYIGRALVARLKYQDFDVVAITRKPFQELERSSFYSYCSDYDNIPRLVELFSGCDTVVHLAALAHQVNILKDSDELARYRSANVMPVSAVSEASRQSGVQRVILLSSIGVNGNATYGKPFTDVDVPAPVEPYALSKLEAEVVLSQSLLHGDTDWVVLRPPLVYGPGCPGNLRRLMLLASKAPLLPLGNLHAPRTLISIDNLLDAILVAIDHPAVSRRVFVVSDLYDVDIALILREFLKGFGRREWRLIPFPLFLLKLLFRIVGKGALWQKFSSELQVDSSAFRDATGWFPLYDPKTCLRMAAGSDSVRQ